METGRVISRRYLLQRLIKQGQVCAVYQGVDQLLQRGVAVKAVPAAQMTAFKAAMRMTAQFSHPNIIGLYDLIVESENLYLVQEYVDGDNFTALLQLQLPPQEVADFGSQICQALLYAANTSRKVCHGDLTPTAIIRDRRGYVRVNNFALPSDLNYFAMWRMVGGEGNAVSDGELPWGLPSEGRYADDTRAVGLLLYQLLAGRPPGATMVEPPADGRLRFMRNVPAELCQVVARSVVRQHPEHINTTEELYIELKSLAETPEPSVPEVVSGAVYQQTEVVRPQAQQFSSVGSGNVNAPLMRETQPSEQALASYGAERSTKQAGVEAVAAVPTMADLPLELVAAQEVAYPDAEAPPSSAQRSALLVLLVLVLMGLLAFAIFFIVGYWAGHLFFPG